MAPYTEGKEKERRRPAKQMEPDNHVAQSRRYEAAESMLQHARTPRTQQPALNGSLLPNPYPPIPDSNNPQHSNPLPTLPLSPYRNLSMPIQRDPLEHAHVFDPILARRLNPPQDVKPRIDSHNLQPFAGQPGPQAVLAPTLGYRQLASGGLTIDDRSLTDANFRNHSDPTSPVSSRGFTTSKETEGGKATARTSGKKSSKKSTAIKEEDEKPPPWSELKTKAGKDRKRLPLACIACRRKKIRCSGEKPACKHCLRSRIPCVYKVTTRKAAPRTDYMAMLDKRLKRMEERVIKMLPADEADNVPDTGRANVRPPASGHGHNVSHGKKRAAEEAFGPDLEEWAQSRMNNQTVSGQKHGPDPEPVDGADKLPSQEIQEHLAEVFFDCLYGQSYLLLHKPSFMRRLRAGAAPPVLVLGVCAIAARFSTHPQINSEPAFLRGEEWAAPAREIVLKCYDQPSITILTVLLILGLHEFGTCQGGRSWMFCGMAMRMAYALQLHRELDYDPLVRKDDADPKLSATDREIRRRTMWACFVMDRFSSSGTERPTCGAEDYIKIQLPTKEFNFQHEIPGPTETLAGETSYTSTLDAEQKAKLRDNMGVASYIVRVIVLWGRVIMYLNLGGKEKDLHELWHPHSGFSDLRKQVEDFKTSLPLDLQFNADNLAAHAPEKLANQFLLLHISYHQVVLFLHRHAIPTTPGAIMSKDVPKEFQSTSAHIAVEAADQISDLISHATEHNLVAPFAGYCAFTASTVHIWSMFSNQPRLQASAKRNLGLNIKYISKMKRYWGMFHFMGDNLRDTWKRYHDHALQKGKARTDARNSDSSLFQYGDWFKEYPNGVTDTDFESPATKVKEEFTNETAVNQQQSSLQNAKQFFDKLSPPAKASPTGNRKPARKHSRPTPVQTRPHPPQVLPQSLPQDTSLQPITPVPPQTPVVPSPFSPQPSQPLYATLPPQPYDSLGPTPDTTLLPDLDRNFVWNAYAGTSGPSSIPSGPVDAAFMPLSLGDETSGIWENAALAHIAPQTTVGGMGYMGDVQQSSAWFMPFNMPPPTTGVYPGGNMDGEYGGGFLTGNRLDGGGAGGGGR
ncbi:MAG: hypothetical protein Q9182_003676 [Xanthomendoza sp. 2 TL-2023]